MDRWGVPYPEDTCNAMLHVNATHLPFNERKALTYYEAAGFSGPAEWCRFRKRRLSETMSSAHELESRKSRDARMLTFFEFCTREEEKEGENLGGSQRIREEL